MATLAKDHTQSANMGRKRLKIANDAHAKKKASTK